MFINAPHLNLLQIGIFLISLMGVAQSSADEYQMTDIYFDKIYEIKDQGQLKYLRIYCKESNMLSISITETIEYEQFPRFSVHIPSYQTPRFQKVMYTLLEHCGCDIFVNENNYLVQIKRKGSDVSIFELKSFNFRSPDYIEVQTTDRSIKWGMGERFQENFKITDGIWTIWNRDRPWVIDEGSTAKSAQTYGHQPVYLAREDEGHKFHLVYLKNTHAINYESSDLSHQMKYFITGGHIQFIILHSEEPEQILKQYHNYIGPAMIPPFWAMGYHQSRWGYKNYEEFEKVVKQFNDNHLPLDTMWSDLDYMNKKAIFTLDSFQYPPVKMRNLMSKQQIQYIPLIDVGVSIADKEAMDKGRAMDVFLKNVQNNSTNYQGAVWPGKVHFVDFLHPNASAYWKDQLNRLYEQIPFSGIWLDMNEPANFQGNEHVVQSYRVQRSQSINMMTIDVNLNHYCGKSLTPLKHKEVHAYYGHLSTLPTYEFLKKYGRPFIISRSNSVGSGTYAGHWTGDNVANWSFLRLSISGNFLFQIFGIQMVGADICGFHYNTNEQLCSRWMQVGSFYPFARNHNENQSISQEPYRFGNQLLETTRLSFNQRYALLKQMYSTLLMLNGTGTFYRPLFMEFHEDDLTYAKQSSQTQFLIGDYLMGAPIVTQSSTSRQVYFPGENEQWYQIEYVEPNGFINNKFAKFEGSTSATIINNLPSPPPTFLRSGKLIFVNQPKKRTNLLDSKFTIIAAMKNDNSEGSILGIPDYNNETEISKCIQGGCRMSIQISKVNSEQYLLAWNFEGNSQYRMQLQIQQIAIFQSNSQFVSAGSAIIIASSKGQRQFRIKSK